MEYKKNKQKFPLAFKKKVGEAAVVKKRKLEAEKHGNAWNAKIANGQNQAVKLGMYYCEWKREGVEPQKLSFSNGWLKDWCKEYQISIKKPNKRSFITASARKKRITDFLKNI